MIGHDTDSTSMVLHVFMLAWRKVIEDYERRRINSEHCLQASLYRHLTNSLPESFNVFAEAAIRLSDNAVAETGKAKVVIDLLICEHRTIVAGIELKYTPRFEPDPASITKDLTSLAHITNRKRHLDRVKIEMPRFREADGEAVELEIAPQRKLIFAAFCMRESASLCEESFWSNFRPTTGYWRNATTSPPNLCIALALTSTDGRACPKFFGPAFDRLNAPESPVDDDA